MYCWKRLVVVLFNVVFAVKNLAGNVGSAILPSYAEIKYPSIYMIFQEVEGLHQIHIDYG